MAEIRDQTFIGSCQIDGNDYFGCAFRDVEMVYLGGVPPTFDNCSFENATFAFSGPAGNTLQFLNIMAPAQTNMRPVVLGLIPALQD